MVRSTEKRSGILTVETKVHGLGFRVINKISLKHTPLEALREILQSLKGKQLYRKRAENLVMCQEEADREKVVLWLERT